MSNCGELDGFSCAWIFLVAMVVANDSARWFMMGQWMRTGMLR